jgi:hypothetical protein
MTVQINIGDHVSPKAGYIPFPRVNRPVMLWSRTRTRWIAKNKPSADVYFKTLPGGRSLTQLLADSTIWINYHPTMVAYGETNMVGGKEIAISRQSFRRGCWTVLATLIHELAHSNGAPGGADASAERALVECGLGRRKELTTGVDDVQTPYDPSIHN